MTGKNILIYDYGIGLAHALGLARAGNICRYYTPWGTGFPSFKNFAIGQGYEKEGLQKILYFFDHIDWADLICFFDVGAADVCDRLRKTTNKPVFGAGKAEWTENNRMEMRRAQQKLGLPTQYTVKIQGLTKLRQYLKSNDNKFVKIDIFREDLESLHVENYDKAKLLLDDLEVKLGPFSEVFDFVVEDNIEGIEPGFDLFFNGKRFLTPYLYGLEYKKKGYIGKFVDKMPPALQDVADKLTPFLASLNYRGMLSTEFKILKGKPYLIDTCARPAYPLTSLYPEVIANYSDVIWAVANGKDISLTPKAKYFGIAPLYDSTAREKFVRLDFNQKYSQYIKTRGSAVIKGVTYAVPPGDIVFVLGVWGNNYRQFFGAIELLSKEVDSVELNIDSIETLKSINEELDKFPENGLGQF